MKIQRDHLLEHTQAVRDLELTEAAITILERVSGAYARRCIKSLQASQQRALDRLDSSAAKLGAPHPDQALAPAPAKNLPSTAKCECGKFRPVVKLMHGYRQGSSSPTWFCDKCIPL